MSRKRISKTVDTRVADFYAWLGELPTPSARRPSSRPRPLKFEPLEGRSLLSASPGATIQGTAYNDLTSNGLTADDPRLANVTVKLYSDDGDGLFNSSLDTLAATQTTNASGVYTFTGLAAGTYFVQETVPAGYVELPSASPLKVVISSLQAQGTVGSTIDSFSVTNQIADASSIGNTTAASSVAASEAIGGHRDLFAHLTSPGGDVSLNAHAFNQNVLEFDSSATGAGNRVISWDGDNSANPLTLNPTGLNHADLTNGGLSTGIEIALGTDHNNVFATLRVYKNGTDWSTVAVPIPNTGGAASQSVFVPFSSFSTGGGAGAGNFSDVGAIQLEIDGDPAANGEFGFVELINPTIVTTDLQNVQLASVGDRVFWDMNTNGIQDAGDTGAANVTVQLLQNSSVVSTTTTNGQGAYQFTGLTPGTYSLQFLPANGSAFSPENQGNNAAVDSDADPTTGITAPFTLTSGQNDTTRDAGLLPVNLTVTKIVDNSTPTVGATVHFTITVHNASNLSQATGVTLSDPLPAGLAFVSATPAQGSYNSTGGVWTVGTLASGASTTLTIAATVTAGGTITNVATVTASDEPDLTTNAHDSAAVSTPASVGDFVFWDMNSNGVQDSGEAGAANVTVQLLQNSVVVATTTTNAQGAYLFSGVTPGTYSLKFVTLDGAAFTPQNQGNNSATDSDPNPSTGITAPFTLTAGQNDTTRDAGLLPINLSIGKIVDNSTPNINSNVQFTITLHNASNLSQATGVAVTDVLPAGLSFLTATPAQGTYNSTTGVWTVGTLASGASTTLIVTASVTTGGVKTNTAEVTAAYEPDVNSTPNNHNSEEDDQASVTVSPTGSIGDRVFWDLNQNGLQDAGEPGAANMTVQLLQNGNVVGATTTNAQGLYQFTGLAAGTYVVKFVSPNGSAFTLQNQGANTAIDSDVNPQTGMTAAFALASGQSDTTRDAGLLPVNLSLTKTVDNTTPKLNTNVTFTITVHNAGGLSQATGVTVSDLLPTGLAFVSASPAQGTYNSSTGIWTIGTLASGASTTLNIMATVTAAAVQVNTAEVATADEPDPNSTPGNHVAGEDDQASVTLTPGVEVLSKAFFLGR